MTRAVALPSVAALDQQLHLVVECEGLALDDANRGDSFGMQRYGRTSQCPTRGTKQAVEEAVLTIMARFGVAQIQTHTAFTVVEV